MMKNIFSCCVSTTSKKDIMDFSNFFEENSKSYRPCSPISKPKEKQEEEPCFHIIQELEEVSFEAKEDQPSLTKMFISQGSGFTNPNLNVNWISDAEIQQHPILELIEKEGNLLTQRKVRINAGGVENNKKKIKDGLVNFGHKANGNMLEINDINLEIKNPPLTSTLFRIYFDKAKNSYFLYNENCGDETHVIFVKLEKKIKINKKNILSLGELHLAYEIDSLTHSLKLDLVHQGEKTKSIVFTKDKNKIVKLGRSRANDVVLENNAFSRVHTTFTYDNKVKSWYVQDGIDDKLSTNGTWIFLDWPWEVKNSTHFRFEDSMFYLHLINR